MYFALAALLVVMAVPLARRINLVTYRLGTHKYLVSEQKRLKRQRWLCAIGLLVLSAAAIVDIVLKS